MTKLSIHKKISVCGLQFCLLLIVSTVAFLPGSAMAENDSSSLASPIGPADLLNFGTSLVIVVAAILLVGFLYSKSHGIRGSDSSVINIVATRALGPKEKIVVVEIADKQLVLGMTASQLQTLHVFSQPVVDTGSDVPTINFAERLTAAIKSSRK